MKVIIQGPLSPERERVRDLIYRALTAVGGFAVLSRSEDGFVEGRVVNDPQVIIETRTAP